jgi:nocardicin N-oxygenase
VRELHAYLAALIAERRVQPGESPLDMLIAARDGTDRLSEAELVTFGATLMVAQIGVSVGIANGTFTLLRHLDELGMLRTDPDSIRVAVEELLRYVQLGNGGLTHVATADIELSGVTIRAGDTVVAVLTAGNRDPNVFPDPDRLDLTRPANAHLAFGHGTHYCLGAQVGRMEMQIAIGALLSRFPGLRLAGDESDLTWRPGMIGLALSALPVEW